MRFGEESEGLLSKAREKPGYDAISDSQLQNPQ